MQLELDNLEQDPWPLVSHEVILSGYVAVQEKMIDAAALGARGLASDHKLKLTILGCNPSRGRDTELDAVYREKHPVHTDAYLQLRMQPPKFTSNFSDISRGVMLVTYNGSFVAQIIAPKDFNVELVRSDMTAGATALVTKALGRMTSEAVLEFVHGNGRELPKLGIFMNQAMHSSFDLTKYILPGAMEAVMANQIRGQFSPAPNKMKAPPAVAYSEGQGLW